MSGECGGREQVRIVTASPLAAAVPSLRRLLVLALLVRHKFEFTVAEAVAVKRHLLLVLWGLHLAGRNALMESNLKWFKL